MADSQRIEDLRRRILKDPASIAFAQLAEEHRRAGQLEEAIRVSRAGLAQHPAYLSARITLGRALLEMGRYDEAAAEFEYVLKAAPDNLTAVRELADIKQRRGAIASETSSEQRPTATASQTGSEQPPTAAASQTGSEQPLTAAASEAGSEQPPTAAASQTTSGQRPIAAASEADADSQPREPHTPAPDPVIAELEAWLAVLTEERDARSSRI